MDKEISAINDIRVFINDLKDELQSRTGWDQFKGGFLVGAFGGSGFAYICLLSIPTFST